MSFDATVHLVRHGQVHNPEGVLYGRLPGFRLSDLGRAQAAAAAQRLAKAQVGLVTASPLERAQETAAIIAEPHGAEVGTDPRLIESGTTLEGVGRTALGIFGSPRRWWSLRNPFKPSWGESFAEIRARMLAAIEDAVEAAGGGEVVIVSHQTPVLVARLALSGQRVPPWLAFTPCATGSVTTLVVEGGRAVSASYFAPPIASDAPDSTATSPGT
ncbi:MAG TPA: histidine phosphatase family protein [Actinomycetota bacterium]|nr:histidine phosphatase family protein [Actinomycetota bacterium]